jgi:hypothetical protein
MKGAKIQDLAMSSLTVAVEKKVVSKVMVANLRLKTEKHPSPYKIGWIKRGTETKYSRDVG